MTLHETAEMLTVLREYFPQGQPITANTVKAWQMVFKDQDYQTVMSVIPIVVSETESYTMPPPAVILKKLKQASVSDRHIDLWNEAEKLISKGTILTAEEFRNASKEVQRYFGNVSRIRELALMPPEQTANERARFLKQIPEICEHYRLRESLPQEVLNMIDGVAEKKQLQEGEDD